ncbi:MAG TPA: RNA polymerase subunit sigma-24 [Microbacteriaceae bacterium]|nr:RNA polymerase subunit sigma-24 [Microbacteriaceae bacterium]
MSLEESFAEEWPRVVGATLRAFGNLDLAEESAQEAFARAAERLAGGESIDNIGAWATTAARRIAVDVLRRERVLHSKLPLLIESDSEEGADADQERNEPEIDDRLGLIFVACDPLLSPEQQIALALRIVCGVPTADIAAFFGSQEATVAARLTRAKRAIARSGERFAWPDAHDRAARLDQALTTTYGVYTLGHTAAAGDALMDERLARLALTLARSIAAEYPNDTEALGLLALIELGEARGVARTTADGMPLTLAEVDRSAWGRRRIRHGLDLAARALPGGGRFALQAGIAGLHSSAPSWEETDWGAIATLYHGLNRVWPAPIVRLGGIIARSHLGDRELDRAAEELRALRGTGSPEFGRTVSAAIADVEERRGRVDEALAALADAANGERNQAVLRYYGRAATRLRG